MTTLARPGRLIPRQISRTRPFVGSLSAAVFDPLDLANLAGWWDPSDTATITSSSGKVSALADKSGLGRTLAQGTDANRPITGTRTQNGLNVLDYDGTAHVLVTAAFTCAQPNTIFVVALNDTGSGATSQHVVDAVTTRNTIFVVTTTAKWGIFGGSATISSVANANTTANIFAGLFDGVSTDLRRNGASIAAGSAGTASISGGFVTGLGQPGGFWNGWIGEIILVNASVTGSARDEVESYLNAKWVVF